MILLFAGINAEAQQKKTFVMQGTVVDTAGLPIPSVTVYIKDKISIGTITDSDGKFSIKANRGDMLVFNFISYQQQEFLVTEDNLNMRVVMQEDASLLEEVVVIGMGSQRKISSVAAVSTVDPGSLQVPSPSVANLLGGKIAGVISMQTSGEPGKNISEFWVRGIGTFGASSGALVLIDGLEGDLNSIDPADIESFSILKDASATAVYGVRGANGVVLVNTKKGLEGKLQITGRANVSLSQLKRMPKYIRAYDYAMLVNEALEVRGEDPKYSPVEMAIIRDQLDPDMYPDVSWQDEVMNPYSWKQTYYASARGGGNVSRYFVSLGMSDETAAYKYEKNNVDGSNASYNTYNYRVNVNVNVTKTTDMFFGSDGHLSIRKEPGMANTDYIWNAQSQITPLMFPIRYSTGQLPAAGSNQAGLASPYVMINHTGKAQHEEYQGKMTLALNQDLAMFLEGLKFKAQFAYDMYSYHDEKDAKQKSLWRAVERNNLGDIIMREMVQESKNRFEQPNNQYRKYHFESNLNYDRLFGKHHRVSGLLYYYLSDQQKTKDIKDRMTAIPVRYQGVSSRLTYNYADTYMIDVNFGYTGSENFKPGSQYGLFPSLALGWVPTSYKWVKEKLPFLDFLKIRGSYGTVGNDRIAGDRRFPYLTLLNWKNDSHLWGSSSNRETIDESIVGADNLVWEKALKADLGIEGRLLNNRLSFVVDIFSDTRDGIFQPRVQVPDYVGVITMPYGNVGKMKSYGSDGNIEFRQEINKNMSFTLRANYTYSKNMVQNWEQMYEKYPYLENTGYPNESLRGYQSLGFFKDDDDIKYSPRQTFGAVRPGDIKYKDINGDGKVDSEDKVPLSRNTFPVLMYGFGGEFHYKNFTLGILLKGTGKTDYFHVGQWVSNDEPSNGMGYVPFHDGESGNVLAIVADPKNRWIPRDYAIAHGIDPALAENPNARFPRLQYGHNNNNSQLSDFWKGDARYLRLQEITLSYNLKNDFLRKMHIASLDLQLVGNNLFVFDKVKIFDPEQAQRNGRVYPIPAVYTFQIYINM
jgi:TonB-linked SusC/RagA family outer membrane protein